MYNLLTCLTCNLGESTMITDPESGEVICGNCGTVAADCVEDNRNGFRGFTNGKDTSRIGPPTSLTMHDMGLYTMVGKADRDSSGQLLDLEMRSRMNRLRTWDARLQIRDASVRNFRTAFTLLNKLKDKLGLPYPVIEKTAYIYRKAQQDGFVTGENFDIKRAGADVIVKVRTPTGYLSNVIPLPTIIFNMKLLEAYLDNNVLNIIFEKF